MWNRKQKSRENLAKVLVVEDEPDMTMVITHFLQHAGYEVLTAENGKEGIEKAASEKPDLILSDTQMPVMNGWEMLEELRRKPGTRHIPVIMVTGRYEKYDIAAAAAYGIADYVAKPFDPSLLLEKISDIFASNRRRRTKAKDA
jgi:two-component system alkaline phosphatase synthesis response regulator PhoP